jgi:cupin 2 domain-containing protein
MAKMITIRNLFEEQSGAASESLESLVNADGVHVERIGLRAKAGTEELWLHQETDEWVMMARGGAVLEFEEGGQVSMKTGDHLMIPRKKKHRVLLTSKDAVWVAVHLEKSGNVRVGYPRGKAEPSAQVARG